MGAECSLPVSQYRLSSHKWKVTVRPSVNYAMSNTASSWIVRFAEQHPTFSFAHPLIDIGRPHSDFPFGANLSGIDLREASIQPPSPANHPRLRFGRTQIFPVRTAGGCFYWHQMMRCWLRGALSGRHCFQGVNFENAYWRDQYLNTVLLTERV